MTDDEIKLARQFIDAARRGRKKHPGICGFDVPEMNSCDQCSIAEKATKEKLAEVAAAALDALGAERRAREGWYPPHQVRDLTKGWRELLEAERAVSAFARCSVDCPTRSAFGEGARCTCGLAEARAKAKAVNT